MATPNPKRSGNPAKRAGIGSSAQVPSLRRSITLHSQSILVRLTRLPQFTVPGIVLALMLVGLSAPVPYAVPALVLVGALITWLAFLSWPTLPRRGRLIRGVMIVVVGVVVVARVVRWL